MKARGSAPAVEPSPGASRRISRRGLVLGALATGGSACEAGKLPSPSPAAPAPPAVAVPEPSPAVAEGPLAGGLEVAQLGSLRANERGGQLVVLLHGWRAHGDDLVPLARELAGQRRRFLVPAAPLPEPGGGRAWWRIDAQ